MSNSTNFYGQNLRKENASEKDEHFLSLLTEVLKYKKCKPKARQLLIESDLDFNSILQYALKNERYNIEDFKVLLQSGMESNIDSLEEAIKYRGHDIELTSLLLQSGAKLHYDIFHNIVRSDECNHEFIKMLLQNVKLESHYLNIAVMYRGHDIEFIKLFLQRGIKPDDDTFQYAVLQKEINFELIEMLLQNGLKPNIHCLDLSVRHREYSVKLIQLLLLRGAELNIYILNQAIKFNPNLKIIKMILLNVKPDTSSLSEAVKCSDPNIELIKLLLLRGAYPDIYTLNEAIVFKKCTLELIKKILLFGVKPNTSSLSEAVKHRGQNIELIKLLIEKGVLPTASIFINALKSERCSVEVVKLLLLNGVKLDTDSLCLALRYRGNNVELINLLLESGAEPKISTLNKAIESKRCNLIVIKMLLENGVKPDTSSLSVAVKCKGHNIDLVKLLIERGAKPSMSHLIDALQSKRCNHEVIKLILAMGGKPDRHIFSNYKIFSSNIKQLSKFLLQYLLIQWFRDNLLQVKKENFVLSYFDICDMPDYCGFFLRKELLEYFDCLKKELISMTQDKIRNDSTLFSLISDDYLNTLMNPKKKNSHIEEVISRLHSGQYIYCSNLLYASLSKLDVLPKLCMLVQKNILISTTSGKNVSLNYETILHLVSFLSSKDSVNFTLAFGLEEKENKLSYKRKYILNETNTKHDKFAKRCKSC